MKYLKLMRIKHYVKNVLVFMPLFFGKQIFNREKFVFAVLGFFCFSLISSAVYIINDLCDLEKDRLHSWKKNRPLASGEVKVPAAIALLLFCVAISVGISLFISKKSVLFLLTYLILNVAYSKGLKNCPIVDIVILASGFVIRVLYGGVLTGIPVSAWLYLVIVFGSLYMGLGKRRNELRQQKGTREVLKYYNESFLDKNMYTYVALVIAFYALWTLELPIPEMIWTVPFMATILLRYSYDIEKQSDGEPVEVLFSDRLIMVMCILYAALVFFLIYFI